MSSVNKKKKAQHRSDHCQKCTQCEYWMHKIKLYKRKIDKHMRDLDTSGIQTANFNSLANLNGTTTSFGRKNFSSAEGPKVAVKKRMRSSCKLGSAGLETFIGEKELKPKKTKIVQKSRMTASLERAYKRLQKEVEMIDKAAKEKKALVTKKDRSKSLTVKIQGKTGS